MYEWKLTGWVVAVGKACSAWKLENENKIEGVADPASLCVCWVTRVSVGWRVVRLGWGECGDRI